MSLIARYLTLCRSCEFFFSHCLCVGDFSIKEYQFIIILSLGKSTANNPWLDDVLMEMPRVIITKGCSNGYLKLAVGWVAVLR